MSSPSSQMSPATTTTSSTSPSSTQQPDYQIYRVEAPANHHKLFVQAEASHTHISFFAHVIHTTDPSQKTMTFVEDTAHLPDPLTEALSVKHLGSVAPGAFDSFRAACRANPPPEKPATNPNSEAELLRRGRVWVQQTIDLLHEDGVLQPPPLTESTHRLPRHHHTRYCVHQRLYCHHPYRRRNRGQSNSGLSAAQTIRER